MYERIKAPSVNMRTLTHTHIQTHTSTIMIVCSSLRLSYQCSTEKVSSDLLAFMIVEIIVKIAWRGLGGFLRYRQTDLLSQDDECN